MDPIEQALDVVLTHYNAARTLHQTGNSDASRTELMLLAGEIAAALTPPQPPPKDTPNQNGVPRTS